MPVARNPPVTQACIAVTRFEACVVVVLLIAKVPVVELVQPFVPLVPAVPVPQEKLPRVSAPVMVRSEERRVGKECTSRRSVEVSTKKGKDVLHALIAVARLAAAGSVVLL